jgi:hypothetical protein
MEQIRFKDSFEYEVDTPMKAWAGALSRIPPMVAATVCGKRHPARSPAAEKQKRKTHDCCTTGR